MKRNFFLFIRWIHSVTAPIALPSSCASLLIFTAIGVVKPWASTWHPFGQQVALFLAAIVAAHAVSGLILNTQEHVGLQDPMNRFGGVREDGSLLRRGQLERRRTDIVMPYEE